MTTIPGWLLNLLTSPWSKWATGIASTVASLVWLVPLLQQKYPIEAKDLGAACAMALALYHYLAPSSSNLVNLAAAQRALTGSAFSSTPQAPAESAAGVPPEPPTKPEGFIT